MPQQSQAIGVGAPHNYHERVQHLSAGTHRLHLPGDDGTQSANSGATTGRGDCFSGFAQLLPYLDQGPLYNSINFNSGPDTAANDGIVGVQPPVFTCPSDLGTKP